MSFKNLELFYLKWIINSNYIFFTKIKLFNLEKTKLNNFFIIFVTNSIILNDKRYARNAVCKFGSSIFIDLP